MRKEKKDNFFSLVFKKAKSSAVFFIEKIENQPITFGAWFVSFLFLVFIRNFLEAFSSGYNFLGLKSWPFFFFHSVGFYLFVFGLFILASHFLTGERIEKVTKASLWLTPWILAAPIFDLIFFKGQHVLMKYSALPFSGSGDVLKGLYNYIFFAPNGLLRFAGNLWEWGNAGVFSALFAHSFGIRIEIGLVVFGAMFYVFLKTKSIWKSLFFLLVSRFILFFTDSFPFFITTWLGLPNESSSFNNVSQLNPGFSWNFILFSLYFLFIVIFSAIWFWRYDKNKFLALAKNVRPERLALYLGAFYYGIYLAAPNFKFDFFDILLVIVASLAIFFSWLFAVGSNDLADEGGDKISKAYRPLPSGQLSHSEMKSLNLIFRVVSYVCALVAGYAFFITILIRSAISYFYSNYPFRLKKYPFISTFCIAGGVTLGVLGGFLLFSDKTIFDFPVRTILFLLVFFTLGMNFIHIKDREGDKKEGVWTLPVIFGEVGGKLACGFCLAAAFLAAPFFYPNIPGFTIPIFLLMPLVGFWVINKKNFKEWQAIALCDIFAALVILFTEQPLWYLIWK